MNARNSLHLALLTLILAGLLTACGPRPELVEGPTATPGPIAQRGGSLIVAIAADVDGLDPHKTVAAATFQITRNLYDTLVQVDPQSRIEPDLAASWETSDDGLRWTFHLRDDVFFHNGRKMTAADVKYSFERILDPDTASPRAKDYQIIAATYQGVRVGMPADDVLQVWGKGLRLEQVGNDAQGLITAWVYEDVTLVMKMWEIGGVTCYRVAEIRPNSEQVGKPTFIETPDDHTVVFTLSEAQAAFLSNLAYGWAAVVPQEAADTLRDQPVGTGPFEFVEWVPDSHVKLRRFDKYFLPDVPYLDKVTFRVITDPPARLISLKTGEVDMVPEVPAQEIASLQEQPGIKVIQQPFNGIQLLAINNTRPPFDDLRVRQALNYAIDKQAVIEGAQWGTAVPICSHMPPVSDFYVIPDQCYPYNPEKARELLTEAGYPNGFETTIALPQPYDFHIRNGEVIADQLAKVGIKAKLETIEWATYLEQVYFGRDYALTTLGHTGRLDPDPFLNRYVSDSKEDYMNYNNPRYDELAKEGAVSTNPARRREIYAEMQRMLADDAVAVYLLAPLSSVGLREEIQGWQLYPIDIYDLRTVWIGD